MKTYGVPLPPSFDKNKGIVAKFNPIPPKGGFYQQQTQLHLSYGQSE